MAVSVGNKTCFTRLFIGLSALNAFSGNHGRRDQPGNQGVTRVLTSLVARVYIDVCLHFLSFTRSPIDTAHVKTMD